MLIGRQSTLGLFEPTNTSGQTLAKRLTKLLDNYAMKRKIIAYVKNEGSTVNILIVHILTIFFTFANLLTKLSFFKKPCNSNKQLYYVTTCKIL